MKLSFKETMDFEEADNYEYDEMWDINYLPPPSKEFPILSKICQSEIGPHLSSNPNDFSLDGCDEIWDTSWDLESGSFSKLASTPEMDVWSVYLEEDDEFLEIITFKVPDPSVSTDDSKSYEPALHYEELLSEQCKEILARPQQYSTIYEMSSFATSKYLHDSQIKAQIMNRNSLSHTKCTAMPMFSLFNSVKVIMELLESMPSLQQNDIKQNKSLESVICSNISLSLSKSSLARPSSKSKCWVPDPQISLSPDSCPSKLINFQPNLSLANQQVRRNLYLNNRFSLMGKTGTCQCLKMITHQLSSYLVLQCETNFAIICKSNEVVNVNFGTRRDGQTQKLFDPGIFLNM